jgi:predicted ester cyclase
MNASANKELLRQFDEIVSTNDVARLDAICTPDMVNHALAPGRPAGLAGTREYFETMGRHQLTDHAWDELTVVGEGDLVMQFGVASGNWLGGRFMGIDTPPGRFARDFAAMYRFHDGRIAERWAVRDDLTMLRQLHALPTP